MPVPGDQLRLHQQLADALAEAFPDNRSLKAMVYFELGENLDAVTSDAHGIADRAFELVAWCKARGRLDELVHGAKKQNPGNDALDAVFKAWPFTPARGLEDPTRLAKGARVGDKSQYVVQELLGCGAMGVVYRVQAPPNQALALKLLLGRAMRDPKAIERIDREARIGGVFSDEVREHVVAVHDLGFDRNLGQGGCAYLAMELLRGETLAERVATRGRLPPDAALRLAGQLASVLHEAARAEPAVVHCDLKPDNLFLKRLPGGGEALKVLDFGIAQVLRERTIGQTFRLTGTPLFAAPEQWEPDVPLTPAADLWAFGLIVFYALVGDYYWSSKLLPGLMEEILVERRYPAASERAAACKVALPEGFDAWFARCVCPEATGRFADAERALAALEAEVRWPDERSRPLPGREVAVAAPRPVVPVSSRALTPPEERGEGLDERVAREGPLTAPAVAAMLRDAATWLALQRSVSPVKGHLEPSRVRFLEGGGVRVLGLEAAAVTDARGGAGATRTLLHGAPGVGYVPAALRRVGEIDDAWALARVAFFALTGSHWALAAGVRDALRDDGGGTPSARSGRLPVGFDAWFVRCSGGDGAARFASAREAAEAFAALPPPPVQEPPPPKLPPKPPPPSWALAGIALTGLFAAGLAVRAWVTPPTVHDAGVDAAVAADASAHVTVDVAEEPPPSREPTCPEGMALIRGGTFRMGSPDGAGEADEHPAHDVTVGTFCIDRTEVSVAEYQACVTAGACTAPNTYVARHSSDNFNVFCNWERLGAADHPVNCLDWSQAKTFCEWGGNARGAGRLLREAEWEFAARGTANRTYPWGEAAPDGTRVNLCGDECKDYARSVGHTGWTGITGWRDAFGATAPVTSFESGETPEHVRNLAGNVWEWIEDAYVSDAYAQHTSDGHLRARDASGTSASTESRVLRGGGWNGYSASVARAADRGRGDPAYRDVSIGVRCARGAR